MAILKLTAGSTPYKFSLVKTQTGGTGISIENAPWEPGDPLVRWRKPIHPLTGGQYADRLRDNAKTYYSGPVDPSYPGLILFPPLVSSLTMTNASTPVKAVVFDSKVFLIGGRYVYYYDPTNDTVTEDEDLGVGVSAVDACVFNSELVVACGESTKIFTRATSGTYTQAGDNTFAIALGTVGSLLWRAASTNQVSNCSSSPRTLANWTPADPNEYTVGDSTYAVNTIIDYGGVPWMGKADGFYAPDPQAKFKNQVPQMARAPHTDNCKGAFVAQGALWAPSSSGTFRIKPGKSQKRGPEVTLRTNLWVRGGVEFGDWIYMLVTNEAGGNTYIYKVASTDINSDLNLEYAYHPWAQLSGTSDKGYCLATIAVSDSIRLVAGQGTTGLRYIRLGRGGGRDPDDSGYIFGQSLDIVTGEMMPGADSSVVSTLVGMDVVSTWGIATSTINEGTLTGTYKWDTPAGGSPATATLLTDQESGSGSAAITGTAGLTKASRFAVASNSGQSLVVRLVGTSTYTPPNDVTMSSTDTSLTSSYVIFATNSVIGQVVTCGGKTMTITSNTGTTLTGSGGWSGGGNPGSAATWTLNIGGVGIYRPEIREIWLYGYSHPAMTDIISLGIDASPGSQADGFGTVGYAEAHRLFRDWQNDAVELTMVLDGYEAGRTIRVLVRKIEVVNLDLSPGNGRTGFSQSARLNVQFVRVDRAGAYAE